MKFKDRLITILLLVLIVYVSRFFPNFIEIYYSQSFFLFVSGILQAFSSLFGFPYFFVFIVLYITFWIKFILKSTKSLMVFIDGIILLIAWFYIGWGFNYSRLDIESKISLSSNTNPDIVYHKMLLEVSQELNQLRDSSNIDYQTDFMQENNFKAIVNNVKEILKEFNYDVPKSVNVKKFWPEGILLRFSTSGFYFPFTAECYFDGGLHQLQVPFVIAHECAHGFGIGDEGICNFIAYLSCIRLDDNFVKYSAKLALWKSLKNIPTNVETKREKLLNPNVIQDLINIKFKMDSYPDYFPQLRDAIYNNFLKMQGIAEGEANYNRYINLIHNYNNSIVKHL